MTDDDFARLVAEEVKNKALDHQRNFLMLPDNWDRWHRALVALVENLQGQIERLNEEERVNIENYKEMGAAGVKLMEYCLVENETRRKKIKRFLFFVEGRLNEVARLIATNDEDGSDQEDDRLSAFFRRSIEKHKELNEEFGIQPTVIDEALYQVLAGRWIFDDITENDFEDEDD